MQVSSSRQGSIEAMWDCACEKICTSTLIWPPEKRSTQMPSMRLTGSNPKFSPNTSALLLVYILQMHFGDERHGP